MLEGILNIYKEKGWTSHDVVAYLRKKLKIKKVGHTGTLDPEAEGVLPVCIGKATKVANYITDTTKVYRAEVTLGISTDTQDHTGNIIRTNEVVSLVQDIRKTVLSFIGEYNQVPPMYSALKVNGKRLYELAREGKEVERKPRKITIYNIEIISIEDNKIDMYVECSKGTYIRTLCSDIGDKLGCGAHMSSLIRTRSSVFSIDQSLRLSDLEDYISTNTLNQVLVNIDTIFENFDSVKINPQYNKLLYNGNPLRQEYCLDMKVIINRQYRVYDIDDKFIGLYQAQMIKNTVILKPVKIFL